MPELVRRPVAASEHELLAGATSREPMRPGDGLSGVPMERVLLGGERLIAKWLSYDGDWVMRAFRDTACIPIVMWETGLYDRLLPYVDPVVVGASRDEAGTCVLLMRDVGDCFVDEGEATLDRAQHDAFIAAMAAMHAGMWGFTDDVGLCAPVHAYAAFSPSTVEREAARGPLRGVPALVPGGWEQLLALAPGPGEAALSLANDPTPLVRALAETPQTLVHGDWKAGNLGLAADGTTILVDWAFPSADGGCRDIAWYLAVNCDRLPCSKEDVIAAYRSALEGQGIETAGWFERQLELSLLGAFLQLGWSKTGDPRELGWWVDAVGHVALELAK
jgi:hypothetical protein